MGISFVPPAAPLPSLKWGPALLALETFLFPFLCLCARSSDDCFLIRHGKEGKREGGREWRKRRPPNRRCSEGEEEERGKRGGTDDVHQRKVAASGAT